MTTKASAKSEQKKPAEKASAPKPAAKAIAPKVAPKTVAKPAAKPSVKPETQAKAAKPKASKVIRDSFTFPETDYQKISELKKTCLALGVNAKKSEILRAGLHALDSLDKDRLKDLISRIEKIKTGRPLGSEKS